MQESAKSGQFKLSGLELLESGGVFNLCHLSHSEKLLYPSLVTQS